VFAASHDAMHVSEMKVRMHFDDVASLGRGRHCKEHVIGYHATQVTRIGFIMRVDDLASTSNMWYEKVRQTT
jgi:hypothetical protein